MQKKLDKFRKQIDKIDNKLFSLLKNRSEIINKVKELKKDLHPKIKISRETLQAHTIQKSNFGYYNHNTIQKIWRELIFASLSIEGSFNIEIFSKNNNESISPLWVLARDHFGTYANIKTTNSLEQLLENINNNNTTVGIIPFSIDDTINWWNPLKIYNDIKIVLMLPFIPLPINIKSNLGIVISKAKPEESKDDISLFLIESTNLKPRPNVKIVLSHNNQHIVLLNGFTKDRALISNLTNVSISDIFFLGCYPKPIQN